MTQVEFKNHWFDGGKLWEPGRQEVPEHLLEILPTSAVILNKDGEPDKKANEAKQEEAEKVAEETKAATPEAKPTGKVVDKDLKI